MALSAVNIVGDVTQLLETLLDPLTPSLASPAALDADDADTGSINIFLYQVLESPHAKNRLWRTLPDGGQAYPPLALHLYYLLTPYAVDLLTEHHVLGDAMRILHDSSVIRGAALPESLRLVVEQLAIVLMPLQLEELTRIWSALQSQFRLSVAYEVRVVLLESQRVVVPSRVLSKLDLYAQT
jgi:hypothetical protein